MQSLKVDQVVTSASGKAARVVRLLGRGGQGEVYEVEWGGGRAALKWYYGHTANGQQLGNLQRLAAAPPPDPRFLWPQETFPAQGETAGFGYVMDLRPTQYLGLVKLLVGEANPTFRALASAALALAECFLKLHAGGRCYCDISLGNVFLDDRTGAVLICDNDNVVENGQRPSVAGTIGFMAPEVTVGAAAPSIDTDKHSLAVLLFHLFVRHHPLQGRREEAVKLLDYAESVRLYGREPLYIFHPNDASNAPHPSFHQAALAFWPLYPKFLKDLFAQAFVAGLAQPSARVTENQWRAASVRLRDSVVACRACNSENFHDPDGPAPAPACWRCRAAVPPPFRLRVGRHDVILNLDTLVHPHHLDPQRPYDFGVPAASVARHPAAPDQWGLKNLGTASWSFTPVGGTVAAAAPGRSVPLAHGTRINFGGCEGEIRRGQ